MSPVVHLAQFCEKALPSGVIPAGSARAFSGSACQTAEHIGGHAQRLGLDPVEHADVGRIVALQAQRGLFAVISRWL